ncbi:MAG: hypothetical protein ABJD13_12045 [Paracoccaceae bacterium]
MIGAFWNISAKLFLPIALSFPQVSAADSFTGAEFLAWSDEAKTAFLQNSIIMAQSVSSRGNEDHARCISAWFFDEGGFRDGKHEQLLSRIEEFPSNHPSAVLIAVIEKECGKFFP